MLIFLPSTYFVIRSISEVGALTGQNLVYLILGWGKNSGEIKPTARSGGDIVRYGDGVAGFRRIAELLKDADCTT